MVACAECLGDRVRAGELYSVAAVRPTQWRNAEFAWPRGDSVKRPRFPTLEMTDRSEFKPRLDTQRTRK